MCITRKFYASTCFLVVRTVIFIAKIYSKLICLVCLICFKDGFTLENFTSSKPNSVWFCFWPASSSLSVFCLECGLRPHYLLILNRIAWYLALCGIYCLQQWQQRITDRISLRIDLCARTKISYMLVVSPRKSLIKWSEMRSSSYDAGVRREVQGDPSVLESRSRLLT